MFRAAVKRLKTLRHPSVLTYVHSVETDKAVLDAEVGMLKNVYEYVKYIERPLWLRGQA